MHLKNRTVYCELRSENPIEAKAILSASQRSYSPRAAGIMPNDDWMIVLNAQEAEEFASGALRDVNLSATDKWAICKLLACWRSGEIKDEAATLNQ